MAETYAERKRRERLEKLKEVRRRQTIRFAIFVFSIFAILLGVFFLMNSPYFRVKEVKINMTSHLTEVEAKRVEQLLLGKNIFFAPINNAREILLKNPWIKNVVFKKDYPSKISVLPSERKPIAQIAVDSSYYLISEDGMILEERTEPASLVQIADLPVKNLKIGKVLKTKELKDAVKVYESLPQSIKKKVLIISAASSDKLIFYIEGVEVIYGTPEYFEEKNQILLEVLKREGKKAIYIDLRVPDSPVVKTKP